MAKYRLICVVADANTLSEGGPKAGREKKALMSADVSWRCSRAKLQPARPGHGVASKDRRKASPIVAETPLPAEGLPGTRCSKRCSARPNQYVWFQRVGGASPKGV